MSNQQDREKAEIEEALAWNWRIEPAQAPDGEFALTIKDLPGFFAAHHDEKQLRAEMITALRAELRAYQLKGQAFPRPPAKLELAVSETYGGGGFFEGVMEGLALPRPLSHKVATG